MTGFELWRINNARFGLDDRGLIALYFQLTSEDGGMFDWYIHDMDRVQELISLGGIGDIPNFVGKMAWVDKKGTTCKFVRLWGATMTHPQALAALQAAGFPDPVIDTKDRWGYQCGGLYPEMIGSRLVVSAYWDRLGDAVADAIRRRDWGRG